MFVIKFSLPKYSRRVTPYRIMNSKKEGKNFSNLSPPGINPFSKSKCLWQQFCFEKGLFLTLH